MGLSSLASVLRARTRAGFKVPIETSPLGLEWGSNGFKVCTVRPGDVRRRNQAKEGMRKAFYPYAPIAKTLGLARTDCAKTRAYLDQEMDDHLESGLCFLVTAEDDPSNVLAAGMSRIWSRHADYRVLGSTVRAWHDAAAELAAEHDPSERHLVWRQYQHEHHFDLSQRILQTLAPASVEHAVYFGMFGATKEARSKRIMEMVYRSPPSATLFANKVKFMQMNMTTLDDIIGQMMRKPVVIDKMLYNQETLELEPGVKCFNAIAKLGGIRFFVDLDFYN